MSLTDMVIMPGADYLDACNAVREKTGGTAKIKSGELGGLIRGIQGGGGGSGVLPAGYTLLEYIKSSGTQHINTKFFPDSNTRVVATVKFDSVPTEHAGLFGSRTGTTEQFWCYYRYNDLTFATRYGTNADIKISATSTQKNVVEMNRNTLVINGQTVQGSAQTFTGQYEMYLFSVNQSGATQNTSSFCLYSCQIYDNDVLVRDYLPCRNPKNEVGLYDTVTGEFCGNDGEGAFDGSAGGTVPTGTKQITENGTYDVTEYATAEVNVLTGGGGDTDEEWIGDGNTHIWIRLEEGRTSPLLGVCPKGTVTVDWGDGTTPDTLTGTNVTSVKWTPTHHYAAAGDYIITLTVDGALTVAGRMGFYGLGSSNQYSGILQHSVSGDTRNYFYRNAVQKIEAGDSVTSISDYAFGNCYRLTSIAIPDSVTSIGDHAFNNCYGLTSIAIPDSVTSIGDYAFNSCYVLVSIAIPDGVTSIGDYAFNNCHCLSSIAIPDGVTSIGDYAFYYCYSLTSITIPEGVTSIGKGTFYNCYSLARLRFESTTPPTVSNSNAFNGIPTDCIISVPVGSLAAYTAATNYPSASTYTYVEE